MADPGPVSTDAGYLAWRARQGVGVDDLGWRLSHLPWRQRLLLRRPRGRVLDFGCGDGVFALALAQRGCQVAGFDHSPAAIAAARRFAGPGGPEFSDVQVPPGRFDWIICTQVLEHLPDDRATLRELCARLTSGGVLLGTVPDGKAFWDPDHRRVYDRAGLVRLLGEFGIPMVRRRYRTWLRNFLPWRQRGAAVLVFELRLRR
jgi:SAM-dependent methyltransferase